MVHIHHIPEELSSKIILDAIILLKNEKWRDIHDELKLKKQQKRINMADTRTDGCVRCYEGGVVLTYMRNMR